MPSPTSVQSFPPSAQTSGSPSATPAAWVARVDIAAGPAARGDHTWTVDGDGTDAYVFGGRTADGASNELWKLDLATDRWALLEPTGEGPAARFGHTATWVTDVGLVVWSGQGSDGFFADVWAYEPGANAWRQLPSLGDVPEARYGSCAALGPDGRLWVSHGFTQDDGRFADTLAYDLATGLWSDMTPTSEAPIKRCLHDCFWSADGRRLILYGGQTTDTAALGDIWAYDRESRTWLAGGPPAAAPRNLYALAMLDAGALIFGGGSTDRPYLDDSWAIDGATLALTPLALATAPPARSGATMVSDPGRGRVLLFGGQGETGLLDDVWELFPAR